MFDSGVIALTVMKKLPLKPRDACSILCVSATDSLRSMCRNIMIANNIVAFMFQLDARDQSDASSDILHRLDTRGHHRYFKCGERLSDVKVYSLGDIKHL